MYIYVIYTFIALFSISKCNELCDASKWNVIKGTWNHNAGECSVENTDSNGGNVLWFGSADKVTPDPAYAFENFMLEVEMEPKANGGDPGILFRAQSVSTNNDGGQQYYIGLYAGGNRVVFGRMNNGWAGLHAASWTIDPNVRYVLTVVAEGTNYNVFIDGNLVLANIQRTEYALGTIGFRTYYSPAKYYSLVIEDLDANPCDACGICDDCIDDQCVPKDCADGLYCNGDEYCDMTNGDCASGETVTCSANMACDNDRQTCVRDCSTFAFDDYLMECSAEFQRVEDDISGIDGVLTERLNDLESDINGVATDLSALDTAVSGINSEVSDINTAVSGIQSSLEGINSDLSAVQTDVSGVATDLAGLDSAVNGRIDGVESSITSINTGITDINTDITDINTEIAALHIAVSSSQSDVSGLQSELQTEVSRVDAAISDINAKIAGFGEGTPTTETPVDDGNGNANAGAMNADLAQKSLGFVDQFKDAIIIGLLLMNMVTMVMCCVVYRQQKQKKYQIVSMASDDEQRALK